MVIGNVGILFVNFTKKRSHFPFALFASLKIFPAQVQPYLGIFICIISSALSKKRRTLIRVYCTQIEDKFQILNLIIALTNIKPNLHLYVIKVNFCVLKMQMNWRLGYSFACIHSFIPFFYIFPSQFKFKLYSRCCTKVHWNAMFRIKTFWLP